MKRKWDEADEATRRKCVNEVIASVDELTDSQIGIIAAQDIIDIVLENLAPGIYNAGVRGAKKVVQQKIYDIETEIDLLEVNT